MLRSVASGTSARTATASADRTSPPQGPAELAPTSTDRSASATTLMNPSLPALWIQPRAEDGVCVTQVHGEPAAVVADPLGRGVRAYRDALGHQDPLD